MSAEKLIRWSGLASILAGVLYFISNLIRPAMDDAASMQAPTWVPAYALGTVAALLMIFAVVGIYARQADRAGVLGLVGFALALAASALLMTEEALAATVAPVVAAKLPALGDIDQASGAAVALGVAFLVSFVFGFVLLGISTMRSRVLPRWGGLLFIIGMVLTFVGAQVPVIGILAGAAFGAAFVWLGYALYTGRPAAA